jgi:2-hydroxy-3-keto-5-methylthiopentenyl-1-phosphate phosphatase
MPRTLVSDFDGTMTQHDFFRLVAERHLPPDMPDYWAQYRSGEITHFSALQAIFASLRVNEADLLAVLEQMEFDRKIPDAVHRLEQAGWEVVVVSAGCRWYIDKLLGPLARQLTIHANPGSFSAERGLIMEMPWDDAFVSPSLGVDKEGVVRHRLARGEWVAFAGDGHPDLDAARQVPTHLRFARGDLAQDLTAAGLAYRPFDRWSEMAETLLAEES